MTTVEFYKTIFRFNLFNLPIDLHKLISPLSIEFIRTESRLHYVCISIYCDFLQVDYCLLKTQKWFELNWFNVAIATTGRLGLRWLPTVSWKVHQENANICILKSFPWARGCCIHVFLVYMYRIGYVVWLLRNMITSNKEKNIRTKIMYDIACLHVKHLQVSYQQLTINTRMYAKNVFPLDSWMPVWFRRFFGF